MVYHHLPETRSDGTNERTNKRPSGKLKEKYTLDSLNEIKGALDEQFQWSRPEDGRQVWSSKLQYFLAITRLVEFALSSRVSECGFRDPH